MKKALIFGVTGQDGSFLTELLLEKGYKVYGVQRRSSIPNTARIDHLYDISGQKNFVTLYGDLSDTTNINKIITEIKPDEIYNLGAQSHVGISFDVPEFTADVNALGPLRILESMKHLCSKAKFYQASSSEMFGKVLEIPQNEKTPFNPQSPYGASKTFAFYITKNFRTGYNMFASNGILFNHESERRGVNFVTRKITTGLARIKVGTQKVLRLGNIEAKRDWGYSKDYVEAIWLILQQKKPDDFVISTGETHTVKEFAEEVARNLGMELIWKGNGLDTKGIDKKTGKVIIEIDPIYYRPNEVDLLLGDSSKARSILGWKPKTNFKKLARIMTEHDLAIAEKEKEIGKKFKMSKKPRI
ncbi:MAG: GDP-mannose 4,6-dehydratase [Candidatus Pacebacteria bacterium]|nr:GDP-mannose 4,6-dehydratase [Candidatus Paceibacterota bacterium]